MSDWGDEEYDDDGIEAQAIDVDDVDEALAPGRAFGIDVGTLASELVDAAVKASVRKQVGEVAAAAVEEALTPELIEALRARAATAALAAVTEQVAANDAEQEAAEDGAPLVDEPEPTLYYGSVDEFVRDYLRLVYRRRISSDGRGRVWAAEWWRFDEAVVRLEALWRSWERLRLDPSTGMSVWWRDHADHHMAVLMDPAGPFAGLSPDDESNRNRLGEPLPYTAPPEGMFPDVRERPPAA